MNILLENKTGGVTAAETILKIERGKAVTTFKFECKNSSMYSPYSNYNDPIYNACVAEVFLAYTSDINRYLEIEVSPNGVVFYALINNKKGKPEIEFLIQNFEVFVNKTGSDYFVEIRIKNEIIPIKTTMFNAFRIEQAQNGAPELQALIPTLCDSFHKPNFFRPLEPFLEK